MTASPAALLRAAADRLDQLAAVTEPDLTSLRDAPWHTEEKPLISHRTVVAQTSPGSSGTVRVSRYIANAGTPALAAWIAAMHPGVGRALAEWLRDAADDAEQIGASPAAVTLARRVIGPTASEDPMVASLARDGYSEEEITAMLAKDVPETFTCRHCCATYLLHWRALGDSGLCLVCTAHRDGTCHWSEANPEHNDPVEEPGSPCRFCGNPVPAVGRCTTCWSQHDTPEATDA